MNFGRSEGVPVCEKAELLCYVDSLVNDGAIREFEDASDELQPDGADLGEGHAYLDSLHTIEFTPESIVCGVCRNRAELSETGSVSAPGCKVSGECEQYWVAEHPENYRDFVPRGNKGGRLICAAKEINCGAQIQLNRGPGDTITATVAGEGCMMVKNGANWRQKALAAFRGQELEDPDAGIETFDGLDSGRQQ
jgi:hypothetical protein